MKPWLETDTFVDTLALGSPSGHISKRALKAAQERIRVKLFGPNGLQITGPAQPDERTKLLSDAAMFRDLAARGMKPRAYLKHALSLEAKAESIKS